DSAAEACAQTQTQAKARAEDKEAKDTASNPGPGRTVRVEASDAIHGRTENESGSDPAGRRVRGNAQGEDRERRSCRAGQGLFAGSARTHTGGLSRGRGDDLPQRTIRILERSGGARRA